MRLLLKTHVAPAISAELERLVPGIEVEFQQRWRDGVLRTASDDEILAAAREDDYVFVTFDVSTIPRLLAQRYERGELSPGVILISAHSFRQNDIMGIAGALAALWQKHGQEDWTGKAIYLAAP